MAREGKSYAGATWNSLMEEETKESIAELFIDKLDDQRALISSLQEMIDCYGSDDGGGPIPIIERAKGAIKQARGY